MVVTYTPIPAATPKPQTKSGSVSVSVGDNYFDPRDLRVAVGSTVTWKYEVEEPEEIHNVVALDRSFVSSDLGGFQSFSYTFATPGRYQYVCSYHIPQGMVGGVTVE